jgi:hypothetical protein
VVGGGEEVGFSFCFFPMAFHYLSFPSTLQPSY